MNPLLQLLRSLGNAGAVANARALLDERRREDWIVRSLARRLAAVAPEASAARVA